jgi:hypothetical protein
MTLISEVLSLNYIKPRKIKKREFKQAILDKLEHLQSNNPKEYWKLINMLKEKCTSYPSQHSFYSLKKKLP